MTKHIDFNENAFYEKHFKDATKEQIVKAIMNKLKSLIADCNEPIETNPIVEPNGSLNINTQILKSLDKIINEARIDTVLDIAVGTKFWTETQIQKYKKEEKKNGKKNKKG